MMYTPISDERWNKGSVRELGFWRYWLSLHADEYTMDRPLRLYLLGLVNGLDHAMIADIGSGAACLIGNLHPQIPITIVASDVLADEYKQMWDELGKQPRVPVERQDMRQLTYDDNTFDIVHCSNALDHCPDPVRAVLEMARICKRGGWVYLRHMKDVGRMARYSGLHQWNIMRTEDKDLLVWHGHPRKNGFYISKVLRGLITKQRRDLLGEGVRMIGIWRKP